LEEIGQRRTEDDLVKRLRRDLASGLSASIGDTQDAADRIEQLEQALLRVASANGGRDRFSAEIDKIVFDALRGDKNG